MLIKFGETVIDTGNEHWLDIMADDRVAYSIYSVDSTTLVIAASSVIKNSEGKLLGNRLQLEPMSSNAITIKRRDY